MTFRRNAGGKFHNSIFTDFGRGIDLDFIGFGIQDCFQQMQTGTLFFANNLMHQVASNIFTIADENNVSANDRAAAQAICNSHFVTNGNQIADPQFTNFVPQAPAALNAPPPVDAYFENANYKGAFAPNQTKWISGWTFIHQKGIVP